MVHNAIYWLHLHTIGYTYTLLSRYADFMHQLSLIKESQGIYSLVNVVTKFLQEIGCISSELLDLSLFLAFTKPDTSFCNPH